jgi:autoinducer 2-degrading protein
VSFTLTVLLMAVEGEEERVADGLRVLEAASQKEPAVLEWRIYRSPEDPRRFMIYERYRNRDGLDAHRASEHFLRYEREILPLIETREPVAWDPVFGD